MSPRSLKCMDFSTLILYHFSLSFTVHSLKSHFSMCFEYVHKVKWDSARAAEKDEMSYSTVTYHLFPLCCSGDRSRMDWMKHSDKNQRMKLHFKTPSPQAIFRPSKRAVCNCGEGKGAVCTERAASLSWRLDYSPSCLITTRTPHCCVRHLSLENIKMSD